MKNSVELLIGAILFTAIFGPAGLVIFLACVIAIPYYYSKEAPTK